MLDNRLCSLGDYNKPDKSACEILLQFVSQSFNISAMSQRTGTENILDYSQKYKKINLTTLDQMLIKNGIFWN